MQFTALSLLTLAATAIAAPRPQVYFEVGYIWPVPEGYASDNCNYGFDHLGPYNCGKGGDQNGPYSTGCQCWDNSGRNDTSTHDVCTDYAQSYPNLYYDNNLSKLCVDSFQLGVERTAFNGKCGEKGGYAVCFDSAI